MVHIAVFFYVGFLHETRIYCIYGVIVFHKDSLKVLKLSLHILWMAYCPGPVCQAFDNTHICFWNGDEI